MLTQTFAKPRPDDFTIEQTNEIIIGMEQQLHRDKLAEMGFASLQQRHAAERAQGIQRSRTETAETLYPELTGRDLKMWRRFLPTESSIRDFSHETPPMEALSAIEDAQALGLFDRIVIWSPEGNRAGDILRDDVVIFRNKLRDKRQQLGKRIADALDSFDPMAIGVIYGADGKDHYFPIVRWGEALLPTWKIAAQTRATQAQVAAIRVLPIMAALFAIAAYVNAIQTYGFGWAGFVIPAFFAGVVAVAAGLIWLIEG